MSLDADELDLGPSSSSAVDSSDSSASNMPLLLTGHRAAVTCVKFDATRMALACGPSIRVHSLSGSGALLENISVLKGNAARGLVTGVDFGARVLVASATDCALRTFDMDTLSLTRVSAKKSAHTDVVTAVKLASNERACISISLDATMKVFDVESGACLSTINQSDPARTGMLLCMDSLDPLSDTTILCGAAYQGQAKLAVFDLRCGKVVESMSVTGNTGTTGTKTQMICSVSYSPSNFALAAGGQ